MSPILSVYYIFQIYLLFKPYSFRLIENAEQISKKKIWNSKIVKDKKKDVQQILIPALISIETTKNKTKWNKSNTNTYLALTVPIRLSSAERANDGSSTVTSNFGKTERKTVEYSHHQDPNCDWWSNTLLKPFF